MYKSTCFVWEAQKNWKNLGIYRVKRANFAGVREGATWGQCLGFLMNVRLDTCGRGTGGREHW